MARIDELIQQIENSELRGRIEAELKRANKQKKFGLVFEDHVPECTPLYDVPIKKGSLVARHGEIKTIYRVFNIDDGKADCIEKYGEGRELIPLEELVCIAEFGDPIYPYLQPIDSVCNAPDSDLWHTLIEADNYHALQLLDYLYHGKVDCIYIDPPYNTGAKDWKYNNNYVDKSDNYKHSKWLSMMEKRLKLAKKLLNPKDSVLIVTIDEKEYLHLGCLLEEIFLEAQIQMVSSVINPSGSARKNLFSRAEEYIFYIFIGEAHVYPGNEDMIHPAKDDLKVRWASLLRSGSNSTRAARPNLFYPVFFSNEDGSFVKAGESLKIDEDKSTVEIPKGCFVVWPMKMNGTEARWVLSQKTLKDKKDRGYVRFGPWKPGETSRSISYISEGTEKALNRGELEVIGYDDDGTLMTGRSFKPIVPLTIWNKPSHGAGDYGSSLLLNFFKEKKFSFPKSLYAVKDTLNFAVKGKQEALIIDFFAGSGTTLHAVNLLNREDNGHRRCIMVTNNEMSGEEEAILKKKGFTVKDFEWQKMGIAHNITWPRTVCSINGTDIYGNKLEGTYLHDDSLMADGFSANATFFKLGFLDKSIVSSGSQLKQLIPVLWMKAGSIGKCPSIDEQNNRFVFPANKFAILVDTKYAYEFTQEVTAHDIQVAYIVTDYEPEYREIAKGLNVPTTYHLYRDYLDNFSINTGRV